MLFQEERGSFSGVYLGHRGWSKTPNGDTDFGTPNLGGNKSNPESKMSMAEAEYKRKCRRNMYIALGLFIVLIVVVSLVLILTVVKSK